MKKRSREVIKFTEEEFVSLLNNDKEDYLLIEDHIDEFDSEKCYAQITITVRRESDNKFFQSTYLTGSDYMTTVEGDQNYVLTEVFVKKVTRQDYE